MKIGIKSGTFRFILRHHVEMLAECKSLCDYLVVLTNSDEYIERKKGFLPICLDDRIEILRGIRYINAVGHFTEDTEDAWIQWFKDKILYQHFGPDAKLVVFHSAELKGQDKVPAQDIADEIVYIEHVPSESTSQLIERIRKGE